jgi:peptidoglycan lytic transglycosylase B
VIQKRVHFPGKGTCSFRNFSAVCLLLCAVALFLTATVWAQDATTIFVPLQKRLAADGFDGTIIGELYQRPAVHFDINGVSLFFIHSEAKLNYDQFASKSNIRKADSYMSKHLEMLEKVEKKYGVPKEVITGIILVETRLGTYLGKSHSFSTLSTMATLTGPDAREHLWGNLPESRRISKEKYIEKADKKSNWAYGELKALIEYTAKEGLDPTLIKGSYAGAIGICQFMPSNILRLARDGNQDGRIDLFDHDDAIASVANYLKHHGWKPGISKEKAYKVILRYNYSRYYANTILKVAERLKG